jgi:hypothetical protein
MIQALHAIMMADGKKNVKPTLYREGQNVIRDGRTRVIVYMPPEAKDVPSLMQGIMHWVSDNADVPCAIIAILRAVTKCGFQQCNVRKCRCEACGFLQAAAIQRLLKALDFFTPQKDAGFAMTKFQLKIKTENLNRAQYS